jgi:hypothetical protein
MRQEDALLVIVKWLRAGRPGRREDYSHYGYDLYISTLIRWYLREQPTRLDQFQEAHGVDELFPIFADAAWELCRRGILRPGVRAYQAQAVDEGGFSVTKFGVKWLEESQEDTFVPTEPERFAELLAPYRSHFGAGFHERAQQAVRCYGAHAYLACCAMCGAAAESILLATAIAKSRDEEQVLKIYTTASGRTKIENQVIGQAADHLKREFRGLTDLIKYWRDEAAHGRASGITDNEAYTSLAVLLRYAMFIHKEWKGFTGQDVP